LRSACKPRRYGPTGSGAAPKCSGANGAVPIGYADQPNWLSSAMIKLKVSEELFKGRHWEAVSAKQYQPGRKDALQFHLV